MWKRWSTAIGVGLVVAVAVPYELNRRRPRPVQAPTIEGLTATLARVIAEPGRSFALRPRTRDCEAVLDAATAGRAAKEYALRWDDPSWPFALRPLPDETRFSVSAASTEELRARAPSSRAFPPAFVDVAPALKPGVTWYVVRFTRPGETEGARFAALTYVDGRWRYFPRLWRLVESP